MVVTFDPPEYIHSPLQSQITVDFPGPGATGEFAILFNYVTDFLQQAHAADERYTVRDGINAARFATMLGQMEIGAMSRHDARRLALLQALGGSSTS